MSVVVKFLELWFLISISYTTAHEGASFASSYFLYSTTSPFIDEVVLSLRLDSTGVIDLTELLNGLV